ncbi:MAG: hypothetical protein JWO38_8006 [Gemmataceae bacterium]|nr:hypothetical protein [Gemmataceae bacterium]
MRLIWTCVNLLAVVTACGCGHRSDSNSTCRSAGQDEVKQTLEALTGQWQYISRIEDGDETPSELINASSVTITFEANRYTLRYGDEIVGEASYNINLNHTPKWFDATLTTKGHKNKDKRSLGIFRIDGDVLTLCNADFGDVRPDGFSALKGSKRVLVTCKRHGSKTKGQSSPSPMSTPTDLDEQERILACIKGWLEDQKLGGGRSVIYWDNINQMKSLYAIRSWDILIDKGSHPITVFEHMGRPNAIVKVRIDSSTKGGMPISKIWTLYMQKTGNDWKIESMGGQNIGDD